MEGNNIDAELNEQLRKLQAKYDAMGQDLSSYLDGLLYSDFLTYWDYIHLDTLLSLQSPKTQFPDEKVFIMYHQITELYFQLILHELKQITEKENPEEKFFIDRLDRVVRYFRHLEDSFEQLALLLGHGARVRELHHHENRLLGRPFLLEPLESWRQVVVVARNA